MATLTITIPDAVVPRVQTALCAYGQRPIVNTANAKSVVVDFIKTVTRNYEADTAAATSRALAQEKADSEIDLT